MAVRDDFSAGEVLAAADLNDTFSSKLDLAGGKILQILRATDTSNRSTTSTSFTDVTGMSVTITPQYSDSAVIILAVFVGAVTGTGSAARVRSAYQITDSSNNAISGAQESFLGVEDLEDTVWSPVILLAQSTPATTSATTYKLRFRSTNASRTTEVLNASSTGRMLALEVSA